MDEFTHVQRIFLTHQTKVLEQNGGLIIQLADGEEEPPPPPPEGDNCWVCWGEGLPFGDGPTPLQVTIKISGCDCCNGTYVATQDGFNPCIWAFDDGECRGSWYLHAIYTLFWAEKVKGPICFEGSNYMCATECGVGLKKFDVSW